MHSSISTTTSSISDEDWKKEVDERIIELLHKLERKHGYRVMFAAETGSRGQGFETRESDCDVKGFFTYAESDYLSIHERPESYLCEKLSILMFDKIEVEVDFSLVEFRHFAEQRFTGEHEKLNLIFASKYVYINDFEPETFKNFLENILATPRHSITSDLETFVSRRINREEVECKKILNTLHCLLNVIHFSNSTTFTANYSFNIWEEIELNPFIDARTKHNIREFAKQNLARKQYSRKATMKRNALPPWFLKLLSIYNQQYEPLIQESPLFQQTTQEMHLYAMNLPPRSIPLE